MARTVPSAVETYLAATPVPIMGDLYEFNSPILGYARVTTWEADVTFDSGGGAVLFHSGDVVITRDRLSGRLGTDVNQLEIQVAHGGTALYGSTATTWSKAARSGALDGAGVRLWIAFFTSAGALVGAVPMFRGDVGEPQPMSTVVRLTIEGYLARLRKQWPKFVLSAGCVNRLYDSACGLVRPSTWDSMTTTTFGSLPVGTAIKVASLTESGFVGGSIQIVGPTSSPLYGLSRTIVKETQSGAHKAFGISPALPAGSLSGLTVKLTKGCPKTAAACRDTFNNLKHYTGAPMVPPDSTRTG